MQIIALLTILATGVFAQNYTNTIPAACTSYCQHTAKLYSDCKINVTNIFNSCFCTGVTADDIACFSCVAANGATWSEATATSSSKYINSQCNTTFAPVLPPGVSATGTGAITAATNLAASASTDSSASGLAVSALTAAGALLAGGLAIWM